MSYTNETTHFGIPLPLGSDLTTPMDYNTAAEAVDEALFEAQGDAATANENAANAVETANAVSEALDTLSSTVGGHTSQISALSARMTNAENEIDDVRSDLEDMIVAFNEPTATSTHAYAIGDYFIYNDVLYKATAAISVGETIVPNTNCSATNVMTEVATGGGGGGSVAAADVSLAPITGMAADDVQDGIEELKSALDDKADSTPTYSSSTAEIVGYLGSSSVPIYRKRFWGDTASTAAGEVTLVASVESDPISKIISITGGLTLTATGYLIPVSYNSSTGQTACYVVEGATNALRLNSSWAIGKWYVEVLYTK